MDRDFGFVFVSQVSIGRRVKYECIAKCWIVKSSRRQEDDGLSMKVISSAPYRLIKVRFSPKLLFDRSGM